MKSAVTAIVNALAAFGARRRSTSEAAKPTAASTNASFTGDAFSMKTAAMCVSASISSAHSRLSSILPGKCFFFIPFPPVWRIGLINLLYTPRRRLSTDRS